MKSIWIFTEGQKMEAITKAKDRTVLKLSAIVIICTLLLIWNRSNVMYWFIAKSIMSAIIGSSFYQWWQGTKMGIQFQKHVDAFMQYLAVKFDIAIAKKDAKFRKQYPLIADRLVALESLSHAWDPDAKGEITRLEESLEKLNKKYKQTLERLSGLEEEW